MFPGQSQQIATIALVDAHAFEFPALGRPLGADGGKSCVFPLFDGFQLAFAGFNTRLELGEQFAAFRRAMERRGLIARNFLYLAQAPVGLELPESLLQTLGGQRAINRAGLGRMFGVAVFDNQAVAVRFDFQTVGFQSFMEGLPALGLLQRFQNFVLVALGVAFKGFLPGLRLNGGGFLRQRVFSALLPAIVHAQAVFALQFPAQLVACGVIPERLMPGVQLRVNHRIGYVHVDIVGVFVNPAMALVFGEA